MTYGTRRHLFGRKTVIGRERAYNRQYEGAAKMGKEGDDDISDEGNEAIYNEIRLDDELMEEQIELHPEFAQFFQESEGLDDTLVDDEGNEMSPHLHLTTHVMLEKQIRFSGPPFVRATLERLEKRGLDPHEARHAIMGVLVELTWEVLAKKRPFDSKRYERELNKL